MSDRRQTNWQTGLKHNITTIEDLKEYIDIQLEEKSKRTRPIYSSYVILEPFFIDLWNIQDSICLDFGTKLYFQIPLRFYKHIVS